MERGSAAEHSREKAVMGNEEGGKEGQMNKKGKGQRKEKKEKKVKGCGGNGDRSMFSCNMKHSVEMEQVEVSGEMSENPCSEHSKGGMSKSDGKKYMKKKKKDKEVETVGKKHTLDANDENVGSEHVETNKSEGEHDSKSKKGKQKLQDGDTASVGSAGDQIVSGEDKKRKNSVTLEEDKQVDLRQNTPAGGDGKSDNKKRKKSKDKNEGGEMEKEKVAQQKGKGRRVSFTDTVEMFSIDGGGDEEGDESGESGLVHGQRFTPEEDAKLMEAIKNYTEMKQLGEKGLEMIRASIKHPEIRGCWAEIATSLPHRPMMAIYKRARILLYRSDERKWTQQEYEIIRRFVEKNGTGWKKLAMELGKSEIHVKDTWRRIKPKNLKKGAWTQDEYQNLFDLVNFDLRVKAHQKFDPGHRLLRDNISWEAISDKLTTRSHYECCLKWYQQLASSLVKQGTWADTDDYLLVEALQRVDAVCVEDVDWERLLDHRSGELCRQRWNQMVRMIGGHREKPFIEQVEVLSRRYCPEMLDYRK
ncbi:DNA-binding protein REB1-like [Phragmites australis]|uniref:DNA-binding protein REB1-like n=1 Tax=Phragmites australis TaxID=29695 RepID=UPI002D79F9F0|nr:DNA-binding protein REB1-like [Phragmites australis]XP_062228821.1 DNA-binding protein REB1-like [Phragmites australis]XP_062228822.1 DNA-binding protein REB1-like [Phragmites australis]